MTDQNPKTKRIEPGTLLFICHLIFHFIIVVYSTFRNEIEYLSLLDLFFLSTWIIYPAIMGAVGFLKLKSIFKNLLIYFCVDIFFSALMHFLSLTQNNLQFEWIFIIQSLKSVIGLTLLRTGILLVSCFVTALIFKRKKKDV